MKKLVVAALVLVLSGCLTQEDMRMTPGALLGAAAGAAAGGLIGAQFGGGLGNILFIASGAAIGGSGGYVIGQRMLDSDWAMYDNTARSALSQSSDGEHRSWTNPETGASGIIRPVRTFRTQTGMYCRDYRATVAVSDMVQSGNGTACQNADGQWFAMRDELG